MLMPIPVATPLIMRGGDDGYSRRRLRAMERGVKDNAADTAEALQDEAKAGPWTIITQFRNGRMNVLRNLTQREALSITKSYSHMWWAHGVPENPWVRQAERDAAELLGDFGISSILNKHFDWRSTGGSGGMGHSCDDNDLKEFQIWSENADDILFPLPDDYGDWIVRAAERICKREEHLAHQLSVWLDENKGTPWKKRKNLVIEEWNDRYSGRSQTEYSPA